MSGKSDFTDEEWTAVTDAPFEVITIMFLAGAHGPISTIKETSAGAHALAQPGNRGSASGLITEIIPVAEGKQARHDAGHPHGGSITEAVDAGVAKLKPAAAALAKLQGDEAAQVGGWLVDIGVAVAKAAKGVTDTERDALGKIAGAFGVAAPQL
jgi:hypothetical protein